MTAVELCARCAGDPRDGIGYHAFDCAEVAPKERVMTASEGLEEARAQAREAVQRALDLEALNDEELQRYGTRNALRMVRHSAERAVAALSSPSSIKEDVK